jgi:hypothetical protein
MKRPELDFGAWKIQFDARLRKDRHAARSWRRLSDANLDMESVGGQLWLACDFERSPGYQFTLSMGSAFKDQARRADRLAKRLAEDVEDIKTVCGSSAPPDLLAKLVILADELDSSAKTLRKRASKRFLNPSFFLAAVIKDVREKTNRSFYGELSCLLDAAYEAHGQEPPALGADALRKFYQRYVKNPRELDLWGSDPGAAFRFALILVVIAVFPEIAKRTQELRKNTGRE